MLGKNQASVVIFKDFYFKRLNAAYADSRDGKRDLLSS